MTVSELIEALKKLDPNSIVIIQKDAEGDGYSPLETVDGNCIYIADTTWSGEVYSLDDVDGLEEEEQEELEKDRVLHPQCVVLVPIN